MMAATQNAFDQLLAVGSADEICASIKSGVATLWPSVEADSVWFSRFESLLKALMVPLVELRNDGALDLSAATLVDHLALDQMIWLAQQGDLTHEAVQAIRRYLDSLPGFFWQQVNATPDMTYEKHGYLAMLVAEIIETLRS